MDDFFLPETMRIAWLVLGGALIIAEFVIPGAVVIFFGAGAILTGAATALGWLPGPGSQLLFWMLSSLVLVGALRRQVRRWFPALESYNPPDETADMLGRTVQVLEDVSSEHERGRVRYQGTTWQARMKTGHISAGNRAKISGRDDLVIYVEAVDEPASDRTDS